MTNLTRTEKRQEKLKDLVSWFEQSVAAVEQILEFNIQSTVEGAKKDPSVDLKAVFNALSNNVNICQALNQNGVQNNLSLCFEYPDNGAKYTDKDLLSIQESYIALHNIALGYNFDIDFGGFDRLPRKVGGTACEAYNKKHITVCISGYGAYKVHKHPEYDGENYEELNARKHESVRPLLN